MPPSDAELSRREAATLFSPPCLSMPQRCQSFHYCCQIFAAAISSRRYAMFSPPFRLPLAITPSSPLLLPYVDMFLPIRRF
jgi:hypothetical protein